MNASAYAGLGEAFSAFSRLMGARMDQRFQEESYSKRLAAAEKAAALREAAAEERAAIAAKTTPVERRTFLGPNDQGPPALQYGKFNRFGDMVESGNANEFEVAQQREGFLARDATRAAEQEKARIADERFRMTEAGRDRRAAMRINAPKGPLATPKPPRMEFREVDTGNGTEIHGFDPITGELKTVNGRPVSARGVNRSASDPNDWLSQF